MMRVWLIAAGIVLAAAGTVQAEDRYGEPAAATGSQSPTDAAAAAAAAFETPAPAAAQGQEQPQFHYLDRPAAPAAEAPAGDAAAAPTSPAPSLPANFNASVDESVAPTQPDSAAAATAAEPDAPAVRPRDLVDHILRAPAGSQLDGTPIALMDAVADGRTRKEQTLLAAAYWDLSAAVANYHLALIDAADLRTLLTQAGSLSPASERAKNQLSARTSAALHGARAAQTRLQLLMGGPAEAVLPLPADPPHAGRYDSRFAEVFAGRENTVARELNDLLPIEFDNIQAMADAVVAADQWLASAGGASADELIRGQELLSLQRREFVEAIRQYNQHIAEYSELATPERVETRRLVAMLIKTSATVPAEREPAARVDANVQPTSGVEPALADDSLPSAQLPSTQLPSAQLQGVPPTYAQVETPPSDVVVAPADPAAAPRVRARRPILDGFRNREHSILRRTFTRIRGELR